MVDLPQTRYARHCWFSIRYIAVVCARRRTECCFRRATCNPCHNLCTSALRSLQCRWKRCQQGSPRTAPNAFLNLPLAHAAHKPACRANPTLHSRLDIAAAEFALISQAVHSTIPAARSLYGMVCAEREMGKSPQGTSHN